MLQLFVVESSLNHDLLRFDSIRSVSIIIDTSGIESCATHQPAPPGNQNNVKIFGRGSMAHVALDKWDLPIVRDVLKTELFVEVEVPHVPMVDRF